MSKEKTIEMLMSLSPKARIAILLAVKERRELMKAEAAQEIDQPKNQNSPNPTNEK
jgi:hypothetical protein